MRVKTSDGGKNKGRKVAAATKHLASGRLPIRPYSPADPLKPGLLNKNGHFRPKVFGAKVIFRGGKKCMPTVTTKGAEEISHQQLVNGGPSKHE